MKQPAIARKAPYVVVVEEGKSYWWCSCGFSQNEPWCDGAHCGTGFGPKRCVAKKSGTMYLCGCKATANPPFCDGTHNSL